MLLLALERWLRPLRLGFPARIGAGWGGVSAGFIVFSFESPFSFGFGEALRSEGGRAFPGREGGAVADCGEEESAGGPPRDDVDDIPFVSAVLPDLTAVSALLWITTMGACGPSILVTAGCYPVLQLFYRGYK